MSRIRDAIKILIRGSLENPTTTLTDPDAWLFDAWGGGAASSGIRVNRESALTYAAVWRAVNLLSRDVGKLPFNVYRRLPNGGRERAATHPAFKLLRRKPNDAMGAFQFKQLLMGHVLLTGNGYAVIERDNIGRPIRLVPLLPDNTYPVRANGVLGYVTKIGNEEVRISNEKMLHIKGFGYDGMSGYSVIQKARESLGLGMAAQKYASTYFRNSGRPAVLLEHPATIDAEAQKRLKTSWDKMYSGLDNAHRTAVLEEGMTAKMLQINAKDSQLIESRQFEVRDVANWFGVPPHKVGDTTRTSYSSLEQENQSYLDEALDGWLVNWEEESNYKLLGGEERTAESHFCEFQRNAIVRADMTTRFAGYNTGLQGGWLNRNEIRAMENLNPIEGGDAYFVPLNMTTIDEGGDDADDEDGEGTDAGQTDEQVQASINELYVDVLNRMCERIARHAAGAAKKPDSFIDWLDDRLERDHLGVVYEALLPIARIVGTIHRVDYGKYANSLSQQFITAVRERLLKAAECQPSELVDRAKSSVWEVREYLEFLESNHGAALSAN
jgi:HK97 family phage portal protein